MLQGSEPQGRFSMPQINRHGVDIHYEVHGTGKPVLLLHGATVNFQGNYAAFGWVKTLNDRGFQAIGMDFRGHGRSGKPHESAAYGTANLAADVLSVLDAEKIETTALVGYSIGTVIGLHLLKESPTRFSRAALVATGDGLLGIGPHTFDQLLPSMLTILDRTSYPKDLPKHIAAYWNFIEATQGDRVALRALATSPFPAMSEAAVAGIAAPTLVISGDHDAVLGQGPKLAGTLGRGEYREIKGADHFSLAVDPTVQAMVADFLGAAS